MSALPDPLRTGLKASKKWFHAHVADHFCFPVWLVFQCLRHRQRAVILCRVAALGDVICTLPMCDEIRKRHPKRLLIHVTAANYKKMVRLSRAPDCVYGARSWTFSVPHHFFGLVEKVYAPRTTDERVPNAGAQCHLIDDLAGSCGLTISNRQPRLFPSPELIQTTQAAYGLTEMVAKGRWIIGISCGRTWPVRMWEAAKWQQLVDLIHASFDVTILQFGFTNGPGQSDEYDQIKGVLSVTNRLQSDELAALIASCRLLVSIDSGPVHIAGAVGTPVIGLFGAVNPLYRLPPDSPSMGLFSDVPCLFCHHTAPCGHWQSGCPNEIRCMKELDVPKVFDAVKLMLAEPGNNPFSTSK
jgi:ADP-heptose:LPS heptosyltransferase